MFEFDVYSRSTIRAIPKKKWRQIQLPCCPRSGKCNGCCVRTSNSPRMAAWSAFSAAAADINPEREEKRRSLRLQPLTGSN
jgi:hypothetical protein